MNMIYYNIINECQTTDEDHELHDECDSITAEKLISHSDILQLKINFRVSIKHDQKNLK